MRGSTEKAGVAKGRLVGGEVAEFAGCVVHGDQLVEAHGIGHAVGERGLVYAPVGVPSVYTLSGSPMRHEDAGAPLLRESSQQLDDPLSPD